METVHSLRIDHGSVQNAPNMSYSQPTRQPPSHRTNHAQPNDLYKPSRSPMPPVSANAARYPYPAASPHQPPPPQQQQQQQSAAAAASLGPPNAAAAASQRYMGGGGGGGGGPPSAFQQQQQQQQQHAAASSPSSYHHRGGDLRSTRISLLPPHDFAQGAKFHHHQQQQQQLQQQQQQQLINAGGGPNAADHHHQQHPHQGQQPFKKIRLQDNNKDVQPLRIDTREGQGTYNPQVEAISPTLPDHIQQQEDQAFRTTKDDLLQQISKVDREITKAEVQICILKKKQQELEELALRPLGGNKAHVVEEEQPTKKHHSLAQMIYAENRKRAQQAHARLDPLNGPTPPPLDWPIYNQPSDASVYQENRRRYVTFKRRLLEYFKRRHAEKDARNTYLTDTYSKLMQEWLRKVDKIESSTKRKAKEAKNREFFEKVFPELRKQREDKERFNRVGARIKSEADLEEIMDNLQEQALEDKKMRSYAVIPPILLDARERRLTYQNNNGHIEDMRAVYKSRQFFNVWSNSEKEIFKEKYLLHPKNFSVIASYLDRKSVSDCVQYYYLSKKTENYKQLLRKSRQRTRSSRNNPQKVNSANNSTSVIDILTTGVTTRLQREQQQKTGGITRNVASASLSAAATAAAQQNTDKDNSPTSMVNDESNPGGADVKENAAADEKMAPGGGTGADESPSIVENAEMADGAVADTAGATVTVNDTDGTKMALDANENGSADNCDGTPCATTSANNITATATTTSSSNATGVEQSQSGNGGNPGQLLSREMSKKKKERRKDNGSGGGAGAGGLGAGGSSSGGPGGAGQQTMETTDDDETNNDVQDKIAEGQCLVCGSQLGAQLHSRPLLPSQASQYGLREEQVPPSGGRVCNMCRCKCVRSRYTHCPLPTCPNSRGRVKRLRSLPQRLYDLPADVRDPILAEFHLPPPQQQSQQPLPKCCSACFSRIQRRLGPIEEWPEEDVNQLRSCLTELGANWAAIGERLSKPPHLIRNYYAANRKRHNLESCLGDRKPSLTDEEESGSSTSSCEEPPIRDRHSSDTASAESPPAAMMLLNSQEQAVPSSAKREDYDSSATETADEAQTPDHYQMASATITPVSAGQQQQQQQQQDGLPPITVKDLMSNVIEFSLKKAPNQQPPTSGTTAPTISSILNSNDSNEVQIVSEYNLVRQSANSGRNASSTPDLNIAKLGPLIGATITPVPPPNSAPPAIMDGESDGPENLTLDLSIKKPRADLAPPVAHKQQQQYLYHQQQQQQQQELQRRSPAVYVRTQQQQQQQKLSPKLANPKSGSITLGTPIVTRYEGLLRQIPPPIDAKMGSITQGTPIHHQQHHQQQPQQQKPGHVLGYYERAAHYGAAAAAAAVYRPSFEQMTSRQTIINDYITSQQMIGRNAPPQVGKKFFGGGSPQHRTPPPQQQPANQQQQQRQGVIQRHTRPTVSASGQYQQQGHEALNSLVDVAVQQPSLPVPSAHEGLGKTMADNLLEPRRLQMLQQQQYNRQRMEMERSRMYAAPPPSRQQQQQQQNSVPPRSDSNTLTAASLIDAIITHQINQTANSGGAGAATAESGGGREMMVNNREQRASDRLFQSFHRSAATGSEGEGASGATSGAEMAPIINVDLESDSKNMTVKELADTVISHDFASSATAQRSYYVHPEDWKRRNKEEILKRSVTPQHQQQQQHQQDERQIIRIAQQQNKYHLEPISPTTESSNHHHWGGNDYHHRAARYGGSPATTAATSISPLDYVKNRIVEVMRTADDNKKDEPCMVEAASVGAKETSDSPGEMVIDEEAAQYSRSSAAASANAKGEQHPPQQQQQQQPQAPSEPKPLLSAQYEALSDEDPCW